MGCGWTRPRYHRTDAADAASLDNSTGLLKEAFAAVTSSHVPSGFYFMFPSGSVVRVAYRNDCVLSKMEETARGKIAPYY